MQNNAGPIFQSNINRQLSVWWDEAESAVHAEQIPRARRFLRWILAVHPANEEAWLWLARLSSQPQEEMAYLRQAHAFHPTSNRTVAALRDARSRQLESAVSELTTRSVVTRCLPDRRGNGQHVSPNKNGNGSRTSRILEAPSRARLRSILDLLQTS